MGAGTRENKRNKNIGTFNPIPQPLEGDRDEGLEIEVSHHWPVIQSIASMQ